MDGVIRNGMLELLTAERINTEFDLNKISNDEQLKEECFPEITKYIYCGLDREKRKASRDKGQYDAVTLVTRSEASKLKG